MDEQSDQNFNFKYPSLIPTNSRPGELHKHCCSLGTARIGCHCSLHRFRLSTECQLLDKGRVVQGEARGHQWINRIWTPEGSE